MKKSGIALTLTALLLCLGTAAALAGGESTTLRALRETVPESVQFTIDGTVYHVPVILPEADALPQLLCQSVLFNTADLRERYPLVGKYDRYERAADAGWNYQGSPLLSYHVGKSSVLYGTTDSTTRLSLPAGSTPPENSMTQDDILHLVYARIAEFQGDSSADLRVYRAVALSGLYHIKAVRFTASDGSGVSYRMPTIDETRPLKSAPEGMWQIEFTQYLRSIPVFPDGYSPSGEVTQETGYWPNSVWCNGRFLDENTMSLNLSYLSETRELSADTALAPFSAVINEINDRIQSGQLKNIFRLTLGYTVFLPAGADLGAVRDHSPDAEYLLLPTWQICGYDLKDSYYRYYQAFTVPDEQTVLQNLNGHFELRLDAATAAPLTQLLLDVPGVEGI